MGILRIISVVALLIQLYGVNLGAAKNLPRLPGNRLSEGADRDLPNGIPIHCGQIKAPVKVTVKSTKLPSEVLPPYFETYPFSAGPVSSLLSPQPEREQRFKFASLKADKYFYALNVDGSGDNAYWLPQGGTINIPRTPNADQPHYVFTPDFSGCSWTVTPTADGELRLRHVEGGLEAEQFNDRDEEEKGGPVTYAMQYKDYGYIVETHRLVSNVPAFAFMHFSGGKWTLYVQTLACAPQPGGYTFKNGLLSGMTLVDSKSNYATVNRVQVFNIPNV